MKNKSKYPPFKKEEILATGRNWFAVQNSAFIGNHFNNRKSLSDFLSSK